MDKLISSSAIQISKEKLEKLKKIHFEQFGEYLSDQEALEVGTRLIQLFKIIGKKIP